MSIDDKIANSLEERRAKLSGWISENAPYVAADQNHQNANTPEQAYWHYGYLSAVTDMLRLMDREINEQPDKRDTEN